jgi:hypothetical protein
MQQITLDLDTDEEARPGPMIEPERIQQVIALMAQAIAAVVPSDPGEDHEAN